MKKGISPLIAAVILIAFVISVGLIGTNYFTALEPCKSKLDLALHQLAEPFCQKQQYEFYNFPNKVCFYDCENESFNNYCVPCNGEVEHCYYLDVEYYEYQRERRERWQERIKREMGCKVDDPVYELRNYTTGFYDEDEQVVFCIDSSEFFEFCKEGFIYDKRWDVILCQKSKSFAVTIDIHTKNFTQEEVLESQQ